MVRTREIVGWFALFSVALAAGCAKPITRPLTPPANAKPFGKVILAPIGTMDKGYLQQLSRYFKDKLDLDIPVSEPISEMDLRSGQAEYPDKIGPVWDEKRQQYRAQNLVKSIAYLMDPESHSTYPLRENLRKFPVVIAVANKDMYDEEQFGNNFVFCETVKPDTPDIPMRIGVVSLARFDPKFYGQRHDSKVIKERLRKFVTQKLGELYYDLPRNDDPGSVLYRGTDNLGALDRVGEGF